MSGVVMDFPAVMDFFPHDTLDGRTDAGQPLKLSNGKVQSTVNALIEAKKNRGLTYLLFVLYTDDRG